MERKTYIVTKNISEIVNMPMYGKQSS